MDFHKKNNQLSQLIIICYKNLDKVMKFNSYLAVSFIRDIKEFLVYYSKFISSWIY